ncbi:MAG: DNA polymerase III subunit delta [Magnetococcales bacterium]|nr:DNA polymerase III subunit delta [Magnetococcales bacterium]
MKLKTTEIDSRLRNGTLPPAVLLYGQEQGLIVNQVEQLQKLVITDPGAADFDAEIFFAENLDEERFISACNGFPFLSKTKFILLKEADKISKEAKKTLLGYLKEPSSTTILVVQSGNLEAKDPLRKGFETSKTAWAIPYYPLEGGKLSAWIRQHLQDQGYQVDRDALQYLSHRLDGDTLAASSELEKLILFVGENRNISSNEVMACVGETVQHSTFGLVSATANGKTAKALDILDRLMESGEEPLAMIAILAMRLRRIIQGQSLLNTGENPKAVCNKLRIFWKEEQEFLTQCRLVKSANLANGLMDCLSADKALKSGGGNPSRIMGGLVMRLASRFGKRP